MTIEPISNGNLRIWLAEEEIKEWGLAEGRPDRVRRLIRKALSAAGRRPTTRAWAEMIPVAGGCVVLVSTEVHRRNQPAIYGVEAAVMQEVAARLRLSPGEIAQVYEMDGTCYVLLFSEGDGADALLREYGRPIGCGTALAAHIAEYGEWRFTMPAPARPAHEDWAH